MDLLIAHKNKHPTYTTNILLIQFKKTVTELQSTHLSADKQRATVAKYWLQHNPLASWRRIINEQYYWSNGYPYYDCGGIVDRIRHYAEELPGMKISLD